MITYIFQVLVIILWITVTVFPFVSGQSDSQTNQGFAGSNCNVTTGGSGCEEDPRHSSFLMQVLIIAGSIAGVILILSIVVCIWHCCHKRRNEGIVDIEASSDFQMSEDPSVSFRRLEETERNRIAVSVFSWGSEFSEGERKGPYENPEVIDGLTRKSRGQIYANTCDINTKTTASQLHVPTIYTNISQYVNVDGNKRNSNSDSDEDYTKPLPQ